MRQFFYPNVIMIGYTALQLEVLQLAMTYVARSSAKTYSREQIYSYFIIRYE